MITETKTVYGHQATLRRFGKESYTQTMKTSITTKGWEALNLRRRTDQYSESSIDSTAHDQILKQ
jgi:hypothetical protein